MDLQLERTLAPDGAARTSGRLLGGVTSTVEHIFCATDLRTGMFFYFTTANGGYAYSPVLGSSRCTQQPLARVVRASAAFPGGIPPLRYKSPRHFTLTFAEAAAQLRITGNYRFGHYAPRIFILADGGIWNNLATEPFLADHPWHGPEINNVGSMHSQPAELLIVANASASVLASSIRDFYAPLLGDVFSFKRSLKIATENTVLPRIEAIRARPDAAVVSILDYFGRALAELENNNVISRLPPECDALRLWRQHKAAAPGGKFEDTPPWCVYAHLGYYDKRDNNADIKTSLGRIPRWRAIMQTLEPGTQKDEPYVPLSGRDKVWFGIWQFWHWLTKEEPADLPRSVRQARRRSRRE